jgi:3-keto-5-aminohexanoate cleavage enzyme
VKARKPPLTGRDNDMIIESIFKNTFTDVETFAKVMLDQDIKPEMEIFNESNWEYVRNLIEKNLLKQQYFVRLVLGMQSSSARYTESDSIRPS